MEDIRSYRIDEDQQDDDRDFITAGEDELPFEIPRD
jgi:hypothetical protein